MLLILLILGFIGLIAFIVSVGIESSWVIKEQKRIDVHNVSKDAYHGTWMIK